MSESKSKSKSEKREEKKREPNRQVYVGHLPFDVSRSDLKDLFKEFGEINDLSIKRRFAFLVRFA